MHILTPSISYKLFLTHPEMIPMILRKIVKFSHSQHHQQQSLSKSVLGPQGSIWGIPLHNDAQRQTIDEDDDSGFSSQIPSQHWHSQVHVRGDNLMIQSFDMENYIKYGVEPDQPEELIGEEPKDKVFRLLGEKILHLACDMEPNPESTLDKTDSRYKPSPNYDTVRACRLVSKLWLQLISQVFRAEDKPALIISPHSYLQKRRRQVDPESILDVLSNIVRPQHLQPHFSDLPYSPTKLHLSPPFFYKEIEPKFIRSWMHFERQLYELQLDFPTDSDMSFYWPELSLDALKTVKFKITYESKNSTFRMPGFPQHPRHTGYMHFLQAILNAGRNIENLTLYCYAPQYAPNLVCLHFPSGIKYLDVPLVKMTPEEAHHFLEASYFNGDCTRLKQLVLRAPIQAYYKKEELVTGCSASFLLQKHGNSLEELELTCCGQEMDHLIWSMRREYSQEPMRVEFTNRLPKLKSIKINAANWQISELGCYQSKLPSLKTLTLIMISRADQIEALYTSRSESVEKLTLSFFQEMPEEVVLGFAQNLPCLTELDVVVKESDVGLKTCFQGFPKLKRLRVVYTGCNSDTAIEALHAAITGIPSQSYKGLVSGELTLLDVMKQHQHRPSLRNLNDLEELKLSVRSNSKIDAAIILLTTLLRMPTLKIVTFSKKTVEITDYQKDDIRKANTHGLVIKWD